MDRERKDGLYDALRLIDGEKFDVAISVLQKAIGEAVSHNREGLIKRSNSFLNGAIKTLQEVSEFEPPMVNMLSPEGQKRWNEFRRKVDEKKDMASRCVRTVIETEGGRRFLEGKHGGLMREGLPGDNGLVPQAVLDGIDELKAMISRGDSVPGEPAKQAAETAAGDGAADRQFIGWRGTPEQLERLAVELQEEKFAASAEAFAGQFKDKEGTAGEPCKWLHTDRSLGYLIDRLIHKEAIPKETNITKTAIKHFLKKDGSKISDSLEQNRSNQKNQARNSRGFDTIDNIINKAFT